MKILDYFFSDYSWYRNLFNCKWVETEVFNCSEHDMYCEGWYEKQFKRK